MSENETDRTPSIDPKARATIMDYVGKAWRASVTGGRFAPDEATVARRIEQFDRSLAAIEAGAAAGEIANARFLDAKHDLTHGFETVESKLARPLRPKVGRSDPKPLQEIGWDFFPSLTQLPSAIRRLDAAIAVDPAVAPSAEPLRAFLPVHLVMAAAKKVAVKKLRGEDLAKAKAQAPVTPDTKAVAAVRKVLVEFTQGAADALRDRYASDMRRTLDGFLKKQSDALAAGQEITSEFLRSRFTFDLGAYGTKIDGNSIALVHHLTEESPAGSPGGRHVRVVKADADARILRTATETARQAQEAFVAKNVLKLAPICDAAKGVPSVRSGMREVSVAGLTGEIVVAFPDGSGFTARNGIVFNVSALGREYVQFPLRFHDVSFPDGGKAGFASEAAVYRGFGAAARRPKAT